MEEELLVEFFGDEYIEYALKTPILMPGISSYIDMNKHKLK